MKRLNENKLDQLFKDGITGSAVPDTFRKEDWAAMKKMLDARSGKKSGLIKLIYYTTGIAAVLLVALGIFLFNKADKVKDNNRKLTVKHKKAYEKHNGQFNQHLKKADPTLVPGNKGLTAGHLRIKPSTYYTTAPADNTARYNNYKFVPDTAPKLPKANADANVLAATKLNPAVDTVTAAQALADSRIDTTVIPANVQQPDKKLIKPIVKNRPAFTLSIIAAPDVNGVSTFSNGRVGTNIGLQLSIRITEKLSINTGAAYAVKPYQAGANQYTFAIERPVQPTEVTANCKVLDIPININYQFYSRGKNSVSFGTGLSSYFMLKENYTFDYGSYSGLMPYDINIAGKNQHVFGVLNLNATYQRKINSSFSLIAQPYMKLPLTGIGNGQVNLRSTGVALGFSWNINTLRKPK
jgi:hypothetical protein